MMFQTREILGGTLPFDMHCGLVMDPTKIKKVILLWWVQTAYDIQEVILYIELAVSFLIGQKHTVNFQNQRLWVIIYLQIVMYCTIHSPIMSKTS